MKMRLVAQHNDEELVQLATRIPQDIARRLKELCVRKDIRMQSFGRVPLRRDAASKAAARACATVSTTTASSGSNRNALAADSPKPRSRVRMTRNPARNAASANSPLVRSRRRQVDVKQLHRAGRSARRQSAGPQVRSRAATPSSRARCPRTTFPPRGRTGWKDTVKRVPLIVGLPPKRSGFVTSKRYPGIDVSSMGASLEDDTRIRGEVHLVTVVGGT